MVTESFSGVDYGYDVECEEFNLQFSRNWLDRWAELNGLPTGLHFQDLTTAADEQGIELRGTQHNDAEILVELKYCLQKINGQHSPDGELPGPDEMIAWVKRMDWLLGCMASHEN